MSLRLTIRHFPAFPFREVIFPTFGNVVHIDGPVASGKTTIYDAIVFVLTGVCRPAIVHHGGVGARKDVPVVTLESCDCPNSWVIQREKKRNGLTVSYNKVSLNDAAAQSWICSTFGVTEDNLYLSCYMPHRRNLGLLSLTPASRRESLQSLFAANLHISDLQEVHSKLVGSLLETVASFQTSISTFEKCVPTGLLSHHGAPWLADIKAAMRKIAPSHALMYVHNLRIEESLLAKMETRARLLDIVDSRWNTTLIERCPDAQWFIGPLPALLRGGSSLLSAPVISLAVMPHDCIKQLCMVSMGSPGEIESTQKILIERSDYIKSMISRVSSVRGTFTKTLELQELVRVRWSRSEFVDTESVKSSIKVDQRIERVIKNVTTLLDQCLAAHLQISDSVARANLQFMKCAQQLADISTKTLEPQCDLGVCNDDEQTMVLAKKIAEEVKRVSVHHNKSSDEAREAVVYFTSIIKPALENIADGTAYVCQQITELKHSNPFGESTNAMAYLQQIAFSGGDIVECPNCAAKLLIKQPVVERHGSKRPRVCLSNVVLCKSSEPSSSSSSNPTSLDICNGIFDCICSESLGGEHPCIPQRPRSINAARMQLEH